MKTVAFLALLYAPLPQANMSTIEQVAACPQGQITCKAWCKKYYPSSGICITGHTLSCQGRFGNINKCMPDKKDWQN
jgi:hypothetical protein